MIHDFHERLKWSQSYADEPFWEACYRTAFPTMVGCMACEQDSPSQRQGVDRVIHLIVRVVNRGYDTLSAPIPINTLFFAINRAMRIDVPKPPQREET